MVLLLEMHAASVAVILLITLAGCVEEPAAPADIVPRSHDSGRADPGPKADQTPQQNQTPPPGNLSEREASEEADDRPPWASPQEAVIRPGVAVSVDGSTCTTNFVFTSPHNASVYIGSAAHCAADGEGCGSEAEAPGRVFELGTGHMVTVVYNSFYTMALHGESDSDTCLNNDFMLLELADDDRSLVNPAMRYYGGPTGLSAPGEPEDLDRVLTYGASNWRQGITELERREGTVANTVDVITSNDWETAFYTYPTPSVFGDSGSPVVFQEDGRAVGIVVRGLGASPPTGAIATSLAKVLEYASSVGWDVELATWDLLEPPVIPA